jgi:hypothetical protein
MSNCNIYTQKRRKGSNKNFKNLSLANLVLTSLVKLCHFRHVHEILKHDIISSCPSVCLPAWNKSTPTRQIATKFDTRVFLKNLSSEFQCD